MRVAHFWGMKCHPVGSQWGPNLVIFVFSMDQAQIPTTNPSEDSEVDEDAMDGSIPSSSASSRDDDPKKRKMNRHPLKLLSWAVKFQFQRTHKLPTSRLLDTSSEQDFYPDFRNVASFSVQEGPIAPATEPYSLLPRH